MICRRLLLYKNELTNGSPSPTYNTVIGCVCSLQRIQSFSRANSAYKKYRVHKYCMEEDSQIDWVDNVDFIKRVEEYHLLRRHPIRIRCITMQPSPIENCD